jgi:hypothetical protein
MHEAEERKVKVSPLDDTKNVKTRCTGTAPTYLGMESKPQQGTIHDPVEHAKKSYLPQGKAVRGRQRRAENENRNR